MNNNDVEQFLDYYLHPDTQADYAIMLSGPFTRGGGMRHVSISGNSKPACVVILDNTSRPDHT